MAIKSIKPKRSLRTIISVWLLIFSFVPLVFITFYSMKKFEQAIDNELGQRLEGNGREISAIFSEFKSGLDLLRDRYLKDTSVVYNLTTQDSAGLRKTSSQWLKSDFSSSITFFSQDGRMLTSVFKGDKGDVRELVPSASGPIYLSEENLKRIGKSKEYSFVEFESKSKISLIQFSQIASRSGQLVGFLEQVLELDQQFLLRLKNRLKLEIIIIRPNGQVAVATHPDFYLYKKETIDELMKVSSIRTVDINIRNSPFGFVFHPVTWGNTEFYIGLGAAKTDLQEVIKKVNYAFFSVLGLVLFILILMIFFASNTILKPLNDLVEALQAVHRSDTPLAIPIKSETEIGLLTESFNEMSRKVIKAQSDLKSKIKELEATNKQLKDMQAQLVHSSKMMSLGQLVAGVAHELNNPIGFIYSNISHLKGYADRLIKYAEIAEKYPNESKKARQDFEIDYIREDLPKLIKSCEDGARRTREIVLGLRNFSRLEEAKIKEVDIHESIDSTLDILAGEIKNRIQVIKQYGQIPLVSCQASQINQVFMNILSNAAQAIDGNGNIWISTSLIKSNVADSDQVQIAIQDSGKGMSTAIMEKIFDPFFSTKEVGQGTGLGLSISYGIIRNHGGEIHVKSQLEIGTEFTILIPVKAKIEEVKIEK